MSTTALAAGTLPVQSIWHRLRDYLLPLAAISVIFVMLVPLPAAALDFLLALSIAASVIVFLSAVQIRRAVELSVFPTLLLLLTLSRLSLNIASSRRILLHGQEGTGAAGKVIEAFGQFVVGGNYVVGFRALSRVGRDSVSRGCARRRAHSRSNSPLHPGCIAGQADGHRRGHERRPDRRGRSAPPPAGDRPRSRVLRRHGRSRALQPARCAGNDSYHGDQYRCGAADRDVATRRRSGRSGANLHGAHRRRRPCDDYSLAAGFSGRRHHADPGQLGGIAGRRDTAATAGASRNTLFGQPRMCRTVPDSRSAQDPVSAGSCGTVCGSTSRRGSGAGCPGGRDNARRQEKDGTRAGLGDGATVAAGGSRRWRSASN